MVLLTPDGRMRQEVQYYIGRMSFHERRVDLRLHFIVELQYESNQELLCLQSNPKIHRDKTNHQTSLKVLNDYHESDSTY
jgi:hypothetical protein